MSHHRFHLLDALRGLASILVVFWHAPLYLGMRAGHSTFLAVDFFFCLSGFVLAFSYERRLADSLTFSRFLRARLIRLFPTYLLGILLGTVSFLIVSVHYPLSLKLLVHLLLLIGFQFAMLPNVGLWKSHLLFPIDFPGWSMFFELLVNILFAWGIRRRLASNGILAAVYGLSFVAMVGLTTQYHSVDVGWAWGGGHLAGGLARVCLSFFAGVLMLRFTRAKPRAHFSHALSLVAALGICLALLLILQSPLPFLRTKPFELVTISLILPFLVYLGSRCQMPAAWTALCVFLGDLSYPLYLVHVPFMNLFDLPRAKQWLLDHPAQQRWVVPFVLLVAGSVAYAALKLYDAPVRSFLTRRYAASSKPPSIAPTLLETRS